MSSPAAVAEPPVSKFELLKEIRYDVINGRTCGNQVVDHNHALAWFDHTSLHFKRVLRLAIMIMLELYAYWTLTVPYSFS